MTDGKPVQDVNDEIAAYDKMRADLEAKYMGQWVLVFGGDLIGVYDSFDAVAADAVRRFGRGPYLIRQVGAPAVSLPASVIFNVRHA
jgi:hypothetical protein